MQTIYWRLNTFNFVLKNVRNHFIVFVALMLSRKYIRLQCLNSDNLFTIFTHNTVKTFLLPERWRVDNERLLRQPPLRIVLIVTPYYKVLSIIVIYILTIICNVTERVCN